MFGHIFKHINHSAISCGRGGDNSDRAAIGQMPALLTRYGEGVGAKMLPAPFLIVANHGQAAFGV